MDYLKGLSHDAVPEMQRLIREDSQVSAGILEHFKQRGSGLEEQKSWQSFNISRNRAGEVIEKNIE